MLQVFHMHQTMKRHPIALAVCCALGLQSSHIIADEHVAEQGMFVVHGNWIGGATEQDVQIYPGARDLVNTEELHHSPALNLEDALRAVPGVQILDETGTGILPNIGIRGLNPLRSERVQLLVDGYPIAIGPYTNVGVSLFPVTRETIEHIDVVRGGAAVHYGPNNVGGIINLTTRPIPLQTEQVLKERIVIAEETGHALFDSYYRVGGAVNDKLALQLQANIQTGEGARDHAETDVANLILDARYLINDNNELNTQLQYYDVDAELPGALSPSAYQQDRSQSQRTSDAYKADMLRASVSWLYSPSDDIEFEWRNFAHDADRTFFFAQDLSKAGHWADPEGTPDHIADSPRLFKVFGTEPRLTLRGKQHTLTLGARYVREKVEFDVNRTLLADQSKKSVRQWRFDTDAVALYASDTISLLNNTLSVTPGIRYETVSTDFRDNRSGFQDSNKVDEVLPGLTIGYQISPDVHLFSNMQRSLVPVQTAQVTKEGEVANETAWNYEAGARMQISPELNVAATLFRIEHDDLIQYDKASNTYLNLGKTRQQGLEVSSQWQLTPDLQLDGSYSYLDSEQRSGSYQGNQLPNAPEHHLNAHLVYQQAGWRWTVSGHYVSSSFSDAANTGEETANGSAGELPSYALWHARVERSFGLDQQKTLNLALAVNNLTDEAYYFRGADVSPVGRVPGQGRSFIVEGSLNF